MADNPVNNVVREVFSRHYGGRYQHVLVYLAFSVREDTREASVDLDEIVTLVAEHLDLPRPDLDDTLRTLEDCGVITRLPDIGRVTIQFAEHMGRPVAESDRYHYAFPSPIPEAQS